MPFDRGSFGSWGIELSRDDFACALAALGVIGLRGLPRADPEEWVPLLERKIEGFDPVRWFFTDPGIRLNGVSARALADAWKEAGAHRGARLEVRDVSSPEPFWFLTELARPAVGAASVYVRADYPSVEVGWEWPLRIGFLDDAPSRRLRESVETMWTDHPWAGRLTQLLSAEQPCDLLLLPYTLEDALAAVLGARVPLRADCTVVLGESRLSPERRWGMVGALRAAVHTSGVALVPGTRAGGASWLLELVREVSHAQPLDVALFEAQRGFHARREYERREEDSPGASREMPFLAASRALVEFTRISDRVARMAERMESPELRDHTVRVEDGSRIAGVGLNGEVRLGDVGRILREGTVEIGFFRESGMASVAAEAAEMMAGAAPAAPPPPDDPRASIPETRRTEPGSADRYIQAQVFADDGRERRERAFQPGAAHTVNVRVGVPDETWIAPPASARFPDEELPRDAEEHLLTVIMTAPGLLDAPLTRTLRLPRSGSSAPVSFAFFVPQTAERVDARILVMHANRVLQTARLRGPVGASGGEDAITVEVEARVRSDLSTLAGRSRFDAALILNHDPAGEPGITKAYEGHAEFAVSKDLGALIDWFDQRLTKVAEERTDFEGGLDSEPQVRLLRELARKGAQLYRHVVRDSIGDGPLARGDRIQVISLLAEARLPVELLYDRESPAEDAVLCPNAVAGLRAGSCASCAQPDDDTVICPFGFWGISKVLERHAHTPEYNQRYTRDFVLMNTEPGPGRGELDVLRAGVCGWTQRVPRCVTPRELDEIAGALADATGAAPVPADSWDALQQAVAARHPSLILLLVHTAVEDGDIEQKAELGVGSWRAVSDIKRRYVRADPADPPPMVVMLGCESGAPTVDFLGFASQLRDAGAGIVVTANSTIHSLHAVPVAAAMLRALRDVPPATATRTLGEVMRTVRREMLAEGNPMVLCLSVFGDADWKLAVHAGEN